MADLWPSSIKIKSKVAAQRLLDKIRRTEAAHSQVDRDKKRLAEALQWALEEISRLEEANRNYTTIQEPT